MLRSSSALLTALLLGACTATTPPPAVTGVATVVTGWRALVSTQDEARIAALPDLWKTALASVPVRSRRLLEKEGPLLAVDGARTHPAPPPGSYNCRLIRLGEALLKSFPANFCYIRAEEDNALSFTKQTGSELPGGWLHIDGEQRMILIGAQQRTAGDNSLLYGTEPDRDIVGVIERVGPFRWRLVLPWRDGKTGLDVYEMTPVPLERQAVEPPVPKSEKPEASPTPVQ